ncbi:MAG: hypothetical protein GC154_05805 [bacterium]|nr:hypothetical protein [bacterium]
MRGYHLSGLILTLGAAWWSVRSYSFDPAGRPGELIEFLLVGALMSLAFLAACRDALRGRLPLRAVLLWAALARLALLPGQPLYETDPNRYLWDGYVLTQGVNPYRYAPAEVLDAYQAGEVETMAPAMLRLCNQLRVHPGMLRVLRDVNNPDLNTIYPPVAQILFGAAAYYFPGVLFAWRLIALAFDAALIAAILVLLKAFSRDPSMVVFYAWSPLVLKEYINTAHFDVIALCGLFVMMALAMAGRIKQSALAGACAVQCKGFPLLAAPFWGRRWGAAGWAVFVTAIVALWVPFLFNAGEPHGLAVYMQRWEANSSVPALLETLLLACGVPAWGTGPQWFEWAGARFDGDSFFLSKTIAAAAAVLIWLWLALRCRRASHPSDEDRLRWTAISLGAVLICSPVCNPWYLAWMTPFLCFFPSAAWSYLSVSCLLYYAFYIPKPYEQILWVRLLEYVPFYVLLFWEWKRGRCLLPDWFSH